MPTKPKKVQTYSGVLAQPIEPLGGLAALLVSEQEWEVQNRQHINSQTVQRLIALHEHYGVAYDSEDPAFQLLLALARDHVPGFQIAWSRPRGRGRPGSWNWSTDWELIADVTAMVGKGQTVDNACRLLAKRPRWKFAGKKGAAPSGATLVRRYNAILQSDTGPARLLKHTLSIPELKGDFLALYAERR